MNENRRDFLKTAGIASAMTLFGGALISSELVAQNELFINNNIHKLPKLPYKFNDLEPIIDATTVEIHYTKHHQGYVDGLNKAEAAISEALGKNNLELIDYWTKKLSFNGAGHYLHTLYWNSMSPEGGGQPSGKLADQIKINFGTFEKFKNLFTTAAKTVEGSGWAMLAYNPQNKKLIVLQIENHQKLTTWEIIPLMVIDVWEHAYYLKYQNKRLEYINSWFDLVNWKNVEKLFSVHNNNDN